MGGWEKWGSGNEDPGPKAEQGRSRCWCVWGLWWAGPGDVENPGSWEQLSWRQPALFQPFLQLFLFESFGLRVSLTYKVTLKFSLLAKLKDFNRYTEHVYIYWCRQISLSFVLCFALYLASLITQLVKNPPAMQETLVQFLGWKDPLQKGQDAHSSILAWRILWTVESMGSQRVGHDWATFTRLCCIYVSTRLWDGHWLISFSLGSVHVRLSFGLQRDLYCCCTVSFIQTLLFNTLWSSLLWMLILCSK